MSCLICNDRGADGCTFCDPNNGFKDLPIDKIITQVQARHDATLIIDWEKEFNPEAQPNSLSNAQQCHIDRGAILEILQAAMDIIAKNDIRLERYKGVDECLKQVEIACRETSDDYAPDCMPIEVADAVGRIEIILEAR